MERGEGDGREERQRGIITQTEKGQDREKRRDGYTVSVYPCVRGNSRRKSESDRVRVRVREREEEKTGVVETF